jgi:tetratricopeptide (TPR) repeat protein
MRRLILTLSAVFLGVLPGKADNWVRVKSPHFTVLSNASEKQTRQVAVGFEQIQTVFTSTMPGLRTDSSAETIVIAAKDESTFNDLLQADKKWTSHLAGIFIKGWEKDYVIIRLDIPDENRNIVYHEYIHKLLHLNFTRLPIWLDEGLAEFYGNTLMRSDGTFVGAPSPRSEELRTRTMYPLKTMLAVRHSSPYYRDADKAGMFYAESWGLTHFLMLGPGMEQIHKMNVYLASLQRGVEGDKAFDDAFGNRQDLEKNFQAYVNRLSYTAMRFDKMQKIDPSSFDSGPMAPQELDARLGGFYAKQREFELAEKKLSASLTKDPKSALAHENSGFLDFVQGKDEEAQKEFDTAVALNPDSYLAIYYQAMMKFHEKKDADSLAQLDAAMTRVIQLNKLFAPAFIVRSQIYVQQGKLQDAYNTSVQAQRIEPDRGGYLTNTAAILVRGNNYRDAIQLATTVAARWYDSDSAEALAVVAQARSLGKIEQSAEEKAREDQEMEYAKDTTAIEGTIRSVDCEKSKPMVVVLQSAENMMKFHAGKAFGVGFSDTLWYGEDHFNPCHHLEGLNALVRYKPSTDPGGENEMRYLEIRDELIPSSIPATQADKAPSPAPVI